MSEVSDVRASSPSEPTLLERSRIVHGGPLHPYTIPLVSSLGFHVAALVWL